MRQKSFLNNQNKFLNKRLKMIKIKTKLQIHPKNKHKRKIILRPSKKTILTMEESSEKERKLKMRDLLRPSQKSLNPNNQQFNPRKLLQRVHLLS